MKNHKQVLIEWLLDQKRHAEEMIQGYLDKPNKRGADAAVKNYWQGKINAYEEVLQAEGYYREL